MEKIVEFVATDCPSYGFGPELYSLKGPGSSRLRMNLGLCDPELLVRTTNPLCRSVPSARGLEDSFNQSSGTEELVIKN